MRNGAVKKLRRIIRKEIKLLRKEYLSAAKASEPSEDEKQLSDNYYLLEKEAKSVLNGLKYITCAKSDESGLPVVYSAMFRLVGDGNIPTFDIIGGKTADYDFSAAEIDSSALMLRAALISKACESAEAKNGTLKNVFASLNSINDIDFDGLFIICGKSEKILAGDAAFSVSNKETKAYFRHLLARYAKKRSVTEEEAAKELEERADAQNSSICGLLERSNDTKNKGRALIAAEIILPHLAAITVCNLISAYYLVIPLSILFWEIIRVFVTDVIERRFPVRTIPKVSSDGGMPENTETLITVTSLLPNAEDMNKVKEHLKQIYLSNRDEKIKVCLLADYKGAKSAVCPEDEADRKAAKEMIDALNRKYPERFIMLLRERVFIKSESGYAGRERKRGAVEDLVKYIAEKDESLFSLKCGAVEGIENTKYIMALDSDTKLGFECVKELAAAAVHPLNRPVINKEKGIVESGYGIFAPRTEITVESAFKTAFSRAAAGTGGVSSYNEKTGEKYQDISGSSIFSGKGLIDVNAYYEILCGRFENERVLSHDIVEGEFLRTAYVPSAQAAEGFPPNEAAYFARLNRWVRGDTQNLPFLIKGSASVLKGEKNSLSGISRYKIFDNFRRAYTPVTAFVTVLLSVFMPKTVSVWAVLSALLCTAAPEIPVFLNALFPVSRGSSPSRYYGDAIPEVTLRFTGIFLKIIMLPENAVCCISAIFKSIYRMLFSKKHLLEWVTAADSNKIKSKSGMAKNSLPSVFGFIWLVLFSDWLGIAAGFLFSVDLPFSLLSSRESKADKDRLGYLSREEIKGYAFKMWRYYSEYCKADYHFLPPDNVQETPVFKIAERTSPTNIGLMLCSVLAARDMDFITSREMYETVENTLGTVQGLKKWHGNLFNWYDIKNAQPLEPLYISTVDSGNFLCSLVALKEGLKEYISECPELSGTVDKIEALTENTDLSVLYNSRRNLFHIGYDFGKKELTCSYYDLLMSEARMTSYYAVAKKQAPKKHWASLSRALSGVNGYYGPVSWSGTVFEYFMPYMFVPAYKNTMCCEALRFSVYCQKLRARKRGVPWGISESGYYKFDNALNYQYKAHGVSLCALKKDADEEPVVSPYSSFLCLPFVSGDALRNLHRLLEYEVTGEFGFYEAVDFSKERCSSGDYAVVRSYMAHHIGMSLMGIDNALFDRRMQKRFMSDDDMRSAESLLTEKISRQAVRLTDKERRPAYDKEKTHHNSERETVMPSVTNPNVHILSNGEWTTVISDSGTGHAIYRMKNVLRQSRDILTKPLGVFAFVKAKGEVMPAEKACSRGGAEYRALFDKYSATLYADGSAFSVKTEVTVHPKLACELRSYTVKNLTENGIDACFCIYLEPSMATFAEDRAHTAFSKLFLTAEKDVKRSTVVFNRRSRTDGDGMCCACGFIDGRNFRCNLSREEALRRPDGVFSLLKQESPKERNRGIIDVCAYIEIPFFLEAGGEKSFDFFILAAESKSEISEKIDRLRLNPRPEKEECAESPFGVYGAASTVFPKLFYEVEKSKREKEALSRNTLSRSALWHMGISGDNPIIYIEAGESLRSKRIKRFIEINKRLRFCGIITDLVIGVSGKSSDSIRNEADKFVKMLGDEMLAAGGSAYGGVHLIDTDTAPQDYINYLAAFACYTLNKNSDNLVLPSVEFKAVNIERVERENGENAVRNGGYEIKKAPRLPWCYAIGNSSFGTVVSDCSAGFTYALNSHENKLTDWSNDTSYDNGSERIMIRLDGRIYDALLCSKAMFGGETAKYSAAIDGIGIVTVISVPERGMRKELNIEFYNGGDEARRLEAVYYCEPVMGRSIDENKFIKARRVPEGVGLSNPNNTDYGGEMRITADSREAFFTFSKKEFFEGLWDASGEPAFDGCAAVGRKIILPAKRRTAVKFILSYGGCPSAAQKLANLRLPRRKIKNSIVINTGNRELDELFNCFLPNQIIDGRLFVRSGFYQCGGAYGFRDQLQDCLALIPIYPEYAKRQLVRCASAQFYEGDVLHWWHRIKNGKRGVRTRYSDDLLWLAYVLSQYVIMTGDRDFLKTEAAYLDGEALGRNESERYAEYPQSAKKENMLMHAEKAVGRALRFGGHSLLLMGGGDWNDGMNSVGILGRGESVWLSEYMCMVLESMAQMYEMTDRRDDAEKYRRISEDIKTAVDKNAFSGDRYIRAFHDDGRVIGSEECEYCKIDSLPQSFAALCKMPDRERINTALMTAYKELYDRKNGIVKLLSPPFGQEEKKVGYISSYPEGLRENGGQYTHAAVWLSAALFEAGYTEEGYEILNVLNPLNKYKDEKTAQRYMTEPYYMCADVYSAQNIEGRGGWSLYTGSAAWYYKTVYEKLLGIKMRDGRFFVSPNLPKGIKGYTARITVGERITDISVMPDGKVSVHTEDAENDGIVNLQ